MENEQLNSLVALIHESLFSCYVVYNSWQHHELQHTRLPCPSLSPWVSSNSRPLSQWCDPTISSSVTLFSSCPQFFPASGSFPMSQLFTSGGQSMMNRMDIKLQKSSVDTFYALHSEQERKKSLEHRDRESNTHIFDWFLLPDSSHLLKATLGSHKTQNIYIRGIFKEIMLAQVGFYYFQSNKARQ